MRNQAYVFGALLLFAVSFISPPAIAADCHAQTENPAFIQAQRLMQQVRNTSLEQGVKQSLEAQWAPLAAEQQSLWALAGAVDAYCNQGKNHPQINSYNARVMAWVSNIQSFTADAQSALANNVVWKRVPAIVPSNASCQDLGGKSLGSNVTTYWQRTEDITPSRGTTCMCKWRACYDLTETLCERSVEEEALINGVREKRIVSITETLRHRQSAMGEKSTQAWCEAAPPSACAHRPVVELKC